MVGQRVGGWLAFLSCMQAACYAVQPIPLRSSIAAATRLSSSKQATQSA